MKNRYFLLRHGESFSNLKKILSSWPEKEHFPLTEKGRKDIEERAEELKNIDFIFSSDLLRTKETAQIVSEKTGIESVFDKRLREYNLGVFNGRPESEYKENVEGKNRFEEALEKGESYNQAAERVFDFFQEMERKYSNKTILVISHQLPLALLEAKAKGVSFEGMSSSEDLAGRLSGGRRMETGELRELTD